MSDLPNVFNDASTILSDKGFDVPSDGVWYHGTSSALIGSIKGSGLRRSGDQEMNQAAKNTMATIGNSYTEQREPVFLTQSKAIAYYWAEQAVRRRSVRVAGDEQPVVFEVRLPGPEREKVRPDVGAASLLMIKDGEKFMTFVADLYQQANAGVLDIDLMHADREEYLSKLAMAYYDGDIAPGFITLLEEK